LQRGCYSGASAQVLDCGRACAEQAGLRSLDDPATIPGSNLHFCVLSKCGSVCLAEGDDAGALGDGGPAAGDSAVGDGASADGSFGACTNASDLAVTQAAGFSDALPPCAVSCLGSTDSSCTAQCLVTKTGLSQECAACWGDNINCGIQHCAAECIDSASAACKDCDAMNCAPAFHACSGT
jgi:hypothetical protein